MKLIIYEFDEITKEIIVTAILTLTIGTSKERAKELAKIEIQKAKGNACYKIK